MSQEIQDQEKVAPDLDEEIWKNCMRNRLVFGSDGPKHEEHLIYRVHSSLRKGNASCYEPIATSIGPYHHGKEQLLDMENHKRRYFRRLLSRNENDRFEHLVNRMKEREQRVRGCYLEIIELESNAFVEMMLLDGCFIVELLLKLELGHDGDDLFVGPSWRLSTLCNRDLVLLENQLPFFLLQEIFEVVMPDETDPLALVKLSLKYLKDIELTQTLNEKVLAPESVHHLLHLWHTQLISFPAEQPQHSKIRIPCEQLQDSKILKCNNLASYLCMWNCCEGTTQKQEKTLWMPSATQLKEAGVMFKASSSNILNIKFIDGVLIIPMIDVRDDTETQLRNLIAFEQCCLRSSHCFTSYVSFLDFLINTSKDVEILHKKGILRHWFDDEQVTRLFNKVDKGVIISQEDNYLFYTCKEVNDYSSRKINKWRARLVSDYFNSPWAVLIAFVAVSGTAFQFRDMIFSVG